MDSTKNIKWILLSAVLGIGIGALLWLWVLYPSLSLPEWLEEILAILGIPGMFAGLIAGGGNVHDPSIPVIIATNSILYGAIIYYVFNRWRRRKQ